MHGKSSERLTGLHKLWCIHTVPYSKYIMLSAFSTCSKRVFACICVCVYVYVFVCVCVLCSQKKGELSNPETAQRTLARGWLFYYTSFYIFMCYFPIFAFASCSLPLNHFHSMSPRCFCALPVFSVRFVYLYSVWFSIVLCVLLCFTITPNISHHSTEHRTAQQNRTAQHNNKYTAFLFHCNVWTFSSIRFVGIFHFVVGC